MSKAAVSYQYIENMINYITDMLNELENLTNTGSRYYQDAMDSISSSYSILKDAESICFEITSQYENKMEQLQSEISNLESELSKTPSILHEVHLDSYGREYTEIVRNPRYYELIDEVNIRYKKVDRLSFIIAPLSKIKSDIDNGYNMIESTKYNLKYLYNQIDFNYFNITDHGEFGIKKLNDIKKIIEEYLTLKI